MESGSRSSRGFDEEDDDDDEFERREGTSKKVELRVRVDGKGGSDEFGNLIPRSKHSATEQRRRSKINDRFQILRDLIPCNDQKRDKASFLLEVIEYVQFLQEKVQKYESSCPGWSDENAKLMPWVKVYFRSLWKDAQYVEQNNNQVPGDGTAYPSQPMKVDTSPFLYSVDDNRVPENPVESAPIPSNVVEPQQRLISDIDNMAAESQSQWLRPSFTADYNGSSDMLNEEGELTVDEGTISLSTSYSPNILNILSQALESFGLDLSQSDINVQINLGKRATRRANATTTSSAKELDGPSLGNPPLIGQSKIESNGEEPEQARKRRKRAKC